MILLPWNEPLIRTELAAPLDFLSAILLRHVSIVAQNGQTKDKLKRGPL